jgi:REP element-mobilizing transposase RayT
MNIEFLNPFETIAATCNQLPHWQQPGCCYFLTYHLGDSLPKDLLERWAEEKEIWLKFHPIPWSEDEEIEYHRRFTEQINGWLDAGYGSCALREPALREIVSEGLMHFDSVRYLQHAFVVMPNHVHDLFSLHPQWSLQKVIHNWKGYSSHEINKCRGTHGPFWQKSYHDRMIRDSQHFANCVRYIRSNPSKAKLRPGEYTLYESNLARRIPERSES